MPVIFCACIDQIFCILLKVANLGLYAVAFIIFGVTIARTHADIENQVVNFKHWSTSLRAYLQACRSLHFHKWAVPLDCIFVNLHRMLLCRYLSTRHQRAKVCYFLCNLFIYFFFHSWYSSKCWYCIVVYRWYNFRRICHEGCKKLYSSWF